jgi:hypothetical protein
MANLSIPLAILYTVIIRDSRILASTMRLMIPIQIQNLHEVI